MKNIDSKLNSILEQTFCIYKKYGIKSVSMVDLCKELKISKKTLYKFVSNKEELISKIFLEFLNQEYKNISISVENSQINAIDFIVNLSSLYNSLNNTITPAMTNDISIYFPAVYKKFSDMNIQKRQEIIKLNIIKGQQQGIYRLDISYDLISFIFSIIEPNVHRGMFSKFDDEVFFNELIRMFIYSVANKKGIVYFESLIKL